MWGFGGAIMTDWTTTERDDSCTASGCMRAGNDLVMPGCFGDHNNMKKELGSRDSEAGGSESLHRKAGQRNLETNQYEEKLNKFFI